MAFYGGNRFTDFLKGPRDHAPTAFRNNMDSFGGWEVVEIYVCRAPLAAPIYKAIQLFTMGKIDQTLAEKDYDKLYHLYFWIKIKSGQSYRLITLEKNQIVSLNISPGPHAKGTQMLRCTGYYGTLTGFVVNGNLWQNAKLPGRNFWQYDAKDNNCQVFVYSCISGNNLQYYQGQQALLNFVMQNTDDLVSKPLWKAAKKITDLAGMFDILMHGKGFYSSDSYSSSEDES